MANAINALGMAKGKERYIVLFDDSEAARLNALRTLGRWASNPELSFTWFDAATMSQRIRKEFNHVTVR